MIDKKDQQSPNKSFSKALSKSQKLNCALKVKITPLFKERGNPWLMSWSELLTLL